MKAQFRPQAKSGIMHVGSIPPFGIELAPDADLKHRCQRVGPDDGTFRDSWIWRVNPTFRDSSQHLATCRKFGLVRVARQFMIGCDPSTIFLPSVTRLYPENPAQLGFAGFFIANYAQRCPVETTPNRGFFWGLSSPPSIDNPQTPFILSQQRNAHGTD
ncbi:hypothetical protein [Burkholderia sp. MSMB1498]|uniref:hypothetical protein n=1 Tax=Burkholderia sp. MSMB1498 TaxID=1637842 RepID=UPI0012E37EE9|nr:hypothetical protein [Burkholderia sp. MSMB1498]